MKTVTIISSAFIAFALISAQATIINIPDDYPTIQEGINAANPGDTVMVASGTYYENLQMAEGVNLFGSGMENTIIDGGGLNDVIKALNINSFVIEGFNIRNSQQGGNTPGNVGVFINPISSSGTKIVRYCHIHNNGNGVDVWNDFGGVTYVEYNIIDDNIYNGFSPYLGTTYLTNNTIVGNGNDGYTDWSGGGIVYIKNNIIAENGRYGIFKHRDTPVYISYNDVWNNVQGDYYEGYAGPHTPFEPNPGTGEISADPLFVGGDPFDYNLQAGSPCIDAGDPSSPYDPDETIVDMGALYHHQGGRIINIPDDYPTIQEGIDASFDGDTVLVQPGTYVENINFNGHNIVVGSLFLMTGDTSYIEQTIIDGDSQAPVVMFESTEDSTAVIMGLSIVNGWIDGYGAGIKCMNHSNPILKNNNISRNEAYKGAGLYCDNSDPIVSNNYFYADTSWHDGGAINCHYSTPIIVNNIFESNYGDCGAAICCEGADPIIENNIMIGNFASYRGGGIACLYDSEPVITNNTIDNNDADYGGGIYVSSGEITLHNNIISRNSAYYGGGIYFWRGGLSEISNNLLQGNYAFDPGYGGGLGGGIYCDDSYFTVINTIFWADSATASGDEIYLEGEVAPQFRYCDIQGGWEGDGNIDIDPLFRDPENGDFHLQSLNNPDCSGPGDSPCIDAGDPSIMDILIDCSWGLGTEISDMGAYGGGDSTMLDIEYEMANVPKRFVLSQNYPNPFNAATIIRFSLPEHSNVIIDIYDILGRRIEMIFDGIKQAGQHSIAWDAKDQSSGMYFYRIQAGDYIETKKMVLLK